MPSASDLSRKNWKRCPKVVLHIPGVDTRDENTSAVAEYQYNLYLYPWCWLLLRNPCWFLLLKAWDGAQHKAQRWPHKGIRWQSTRRASGTDHQQDVQASADLAFVLMPLVPSKPLICYGHLGSAHHKPGHMSVLAHILNFNVCLEE